MVADQATLHSCGHPISGAERGHATYSQKIQVTDTHTHTHRLGEEAGVIATQIRIVLSLVLYPMTPVHGTAIYLFICIVCFRLSCDRCLTIADLFST